MRAGLTQEMLAERAGLGTRSIQGFERGERRPHRETVRRLADALGLEGADRSELEDAARPVPRPGGIVQVPELSTARPDERWPSREVGRSLPVYLTTFVGREAEGAAVIGLLAGTRLLTLTGTGGCGKTRLAVHLAGALAGAYPTGVRFVDLASLADPSLVPAAVLAALGLREVPGRAPAAAVAAHLRGRAALLLLDNCEHLVEACARLAEALLAACPGLRVLATSREPLGVAGETVWRVPSLPTPRLGEAPALDRLAAYPSVRLFMDRASAIAPPFALTAATASAVARVCRRLDGVPLALELAASRVRVLTPEQIAARLDDRFGLLTGGSRTAPPRQQTLRATLDWSHDLLAEAERALFRRLSVFAGGWTIEAAEEVCSGAPASGHPIRADDVLDLLTALVDKSLVLAEVRAGAGRYRLLETVRQYAAERLAAAGETEVTRRCQRAWCLALAERARAALRGPEQHAWMDRLETEHDNLRAALDWSHADPEGAETTLRLAAALADFWHNGGHAEEGLRWLGRALGRSAGAAPLVRARALTGTGALATDVGDPERAGVSLREALALCREGATGRARPRR